MTVEQAELLFTEEHDLEIRRGGTEREATRVALAAVLECAEDISALSRRGLA